MTFSILNLLQKHDIDGLKSELEMSSFCSIQTKQKNYLGEQKIIFLLFYGLFQHT